MSPQQIFTIDSALSPNDSHKVSIVINKSTSSTSLSMDRIEVTVVDSKTNSLEIIEVELPKDLKIEKRDQEGCSQQSSTIDVTSPIEKKRIEIQNKKKKTRFGFWSNIKNKLKKTLRRLVSSKPYIYIEVIISMVAEFLSMAFFEL